MSNKTKKAKKNKTIWFLIVGIVFVISSFFAFGDGSGVGFGMMFFGIALIAVWAAKKGLFAKLKNKPATDPAPVEEKIKRLKIYQSKIGTHPLKYLYDRELIPADGVDIINDVLIDEEKIVDVKADGDRIALVYGGKTVGYVDDPSKAQMVSDFAEKGFPVQAVIRPSGKDVTLRFFKDGRVGQEWREQSVFKLTGYKSNSCQEAMEGMEDGDELEVEEETDDDGENSKYIVKNRLDEKIGKLPAAAEKKCEEKDPYGVWLEKIEETHTDGGDWVYVPYVRIYW